jgi:integrase
MPLRRRARIRKPTDHPQWSFVVIRKSTKTDADGPVFPDSLGGLRDPSNTLRALRDARGGDEFAWVTSHVFRKTAATILDEAGLTARVVADQLGHSQPLMTQDVYMGRRTISRAGADALDATLTRADS